MQVLFTYLKDPSWPQPGHDVSTEVVETSASLARLGVKVSILTSRSERESLQAGGENQSFRVAPLLRVIPMSRLKEMRNEALLQSNLSLLAQMASLRLRGQRADLIHCFGWEAGLASGLFCQLEDVPLVCTLRDAIRTRSPWLADPQRAYARYITRWLVRRSQRLICPDQYAGDKIQDLFLVKDEHMVVLPPLTGIHDVGEEESPPQDSKPSILYAGPLGRQSGVDDLLSACSRLLSRPAGNFHLVLATCDQSPEASLVRQTIRKMGIAQHVQFVSHTGLKRLVRDHFPTKIKLLVVPGEMEFVGNLVFQALADGVPVVAADGGALGGMIENGVNGLKFSHGHVGSMAEALKAALFDRNLYRQMARGARQQVGRRREIGPRLLKIYHEACDAPGTPVGKGGESDDLRLSESGGDRGAGRS